MIKEKQLKLIQEAEDKLKELKESYENIGWKPDRLLSQDESCGLSYSYEIFDKVELISSDYLVSARKAMKRAFWEYSLALELNEGWKPDWNSNDDKYVVYPVKNELIVELCWNRAYTAILVFRSEKLAEKAIKIMKNWELDKEDVS